MPRLPRLPIDPGRAVLSVVLSTVLYFFVVSETNPEAVRVTDFTINPQVVNAPSGLVVTDRPPPVRLRVQAPQDVLNRLDPQSFTAQVDAAGAQAGEHSLPVRIQSTNPDIQSVTAEPAQVTLHLEPVEERNIPVRVVLSGQVPFGYQVGTATADPSQVTVSGAASLVNQAAAAIVTLNVDRATVAVNSSYAPSVVDGLSNPLQGLTLNPPSVRVNVPISQQTQYKQVGIRPVITGVPATGYLVQPVVVEPATATVAGDPNVLQGISFVDTQPIDVSGISSTVVRKVGLVAPSQTLLLQPDQTVVATIRVTPLPLTQTFRVTPSVINVPQGLTVASAPTLVSLTITGPAPDLGKLSASDFQVVLDASGKGAGTTALKPKVQNVPSGMTVNSIQPGTVNVTLQAPPSPTPAPTSGS